VNPRMKKEWTISLGETAEVVASAYKITRAEQDAFAWRASSALSGRQGVRVHERAGTVPLPTARRLRRMSIRAPGRRLETVAKLKPAFKKDGTVTAASSSGINDERRPS